MRDLLHRFRRSTVVFAAVATALRVGANLILLPLVVTHLSESEQALWGVFVTLGGFANLADFGLGACISRVYSYFWAGASEYRAEGVPQTSGGGAPNLEAIRRLNATVNRLYFYLAGGAVFFLATFGSLYLWKPVQDAPHVLHVWQWWALSVAVVGYNFWAGHWGMANQGMNRVREMQISYVGSSVIYLLVGGVLLVRQWGLGAMVVAGLARGLWMHFAFARTFRQQIPATGAKIAPDFSILSQIWPNAKKFGIMSLGGYLIINCPILISKYCLEDRITASMVITLQAVTFITSFSTLWLSVKWPEITVLRTQGRLETMAALFGRRLLLTMGTFTVMALLLGLLGNTLLEWKHARSRLLEPPFLAFYLAYAGWQTFYVQFGMLTFTENVVPFFRVSLYTGLAAVSLSVLLTPLWGLWGLLLAPFLAEAACSSWFTVWRGWSGQPFTPGKLWRAAWQGHP